MCLQFVYSSFLQFTTIHSFILFIFSLLSSCSSFRDSTLDDQGQGNENEEGADLNGITKRFKGIIYDSV